MDTKLAYLNILKETRAMMAHLPHLAEFAGLPAEDLPFLPPEPRPLAVSKTIPAIAAMSEGWIRPLAMAIADAVPLLRLEQSYLRNEVGSEYLRHYGWFNLVSPDGPFVSKDTRISVGVWGQGLIYPEHWHEPEEIYAVIAGGAVLRVPGCPPVRLRPGHTAEVASNQPHEIDMTDSPMLAMAFWKGVHLTEKPKLTQSA